LTTKVHLRCDNYGQPLVILLSPGQQHESTMLPALLEHGQVKRPGRGRPRVRPRRVVGDKGYSYPHLRRYLRQRGIRITIARRKDQPRGGPFDRAVYKMRNVVERLINRLKQFRRLATRYEKLAERYRAMWLLGAIYLFSFSNRP
jgi:transposase